MTAADVFAEQRQRILSDPARRARSKANGIAARARLAAGGVRPIPGPRPPCRHRGEPTGEMRSCPTCKGAVEVKLLACALHTVCSVARPVGVACCATCADYSAS